MFNIYPLQIFTNCSCVPLLDPGKSRRDGHTVPGLPPEFPPPFQYSINVAVRDRCATACNLIPWFLVSFVIFAFVTMAATVPSLTAGLR